jgi:TolB protein
LAVAAVIMAGIALFAATAFHGGKEGSAPATVAPSGSRLSLTVVGLDGSIRSTIPGLPRSVVHPDISPDGVRVAFTIQDGAVSQIATMRLDGKGFQVISSGQFQADRPRWSPDGSQLLFNRVNNKNGIARLTVMNADGTNVREIRGTQSAQNVPADWSPDGSLILYTSGVGGSRNLATVPATGGTSHRLTTSRHLDEGPGAWSPDGSSIAFTRGNGFGYEVWLMNTDGSGQRRLASLPHRDAQAPEWSPEGSTIAFIGSGGSTAGSDGVYVVDVATGKVTEVLRGIASWGLYDSRATWLPDGNALLVLTQST